MMMTTTTINTVGGFQIGFISVKCFSTLGKCSLLCSHSICNSKLNFDG
jgi:hypothetical protein